MLNKPKRNEVKMNFRIDPEMRQALRYLSEKYNVTYSLIMREALTNYFKMLPENELPHPPDAEPVPVVYQQQEGK